MNKFRSIFNGLFKDFSYGALASASFLVSLISGLFLSVFYDPAQAYQSLTNILLYNPWASYWRNLHYWSAQLFLVFAIIHFWGWLRAKNFKVLKTGLWFRLNLALVFIFLVMFSGFLVKGDKDSEQAGLIFRSLLEALPLAGKLLVQTLLGRQGSYLLPYVHHIATASIILIFIIREHAHKIWTGRTVFITALTPVLLLSLFFVPPLHDGFDSVVKGPWYFVGLQELLHWTTKPWLVWIVVALFLLLVFLLKYLTFSYARIARILLLLSGVSYLALTLVAVFFRGENWQWTIPGKGENSSHYAWFSNVLKDKTLQMDITPVTKGKESCLHCHDHFTGLIAGHAPDKIGCYSCHGGNRFSLDKVESHKNMRLIPGNLKDAGQSCGTSSCHPDIMSRIDNSLMTRLSGLIAVDRWVFGETTSPDAGNDIHNLKNTPAGIHLQNLCLSCHLGGIKTKAGPVTEESRGGGCLACHLNYSKEALSQLSQYKADSKPATLKNFVHPSLDIKVSNDHCFGCHSRSGRISTNYEGWTEILPEESKNKAGKRYRNIGEDRIFEYVAEDVHHKAGMSCIDCHSAREVMGDGIKHIHKEEAVSIRCTDCHTNQVKKKIHFREMDYESAKLINLWKLDTAGSYLVQNKGEAVILGARSIGSDSLFFRTKSGGSTLRLKPPATICTRGKAHDELHCSACHAGWAPRCIGCHTTFDEKAKGINLYDNSKTRGKWEEAMAGFLYGPPTLGVRTVKGHKTIIPVIPGMIMSLDQSNFKGKGSTFHRLFAPLEPHTTQKAGRSCVSCHYDPIALGFGEGKLEFRISGRTGVWFFTPGYTLSKEDGLPQDAWTGFLQQRNGAVSTRLNIRPFSVEEQKNILKVGACLTCHEGNSKVMLESLDDFQAVLKRISSKCSVYE